MRGGYGLTVNPIPFDRPLRGLPPHDRAGVCLADPVHAGRSLDAVAASCVGTATRDALLDWDINAAASVLEQSERWRTAGWVAGTNVKNPRFMQATSSKQAFDRQVRLGLRYRFDGPWGRRVTGPFSASRSTSFTRHKKVDSCW